jgi:hypothetical protein
MRGVSKRPGRALNDRPLCMHGTVLTAGRCWPASARRVNFVLVGSMTRNWTRWEGKVRTTSLVAFAYVVLGYVATSRAAEQIDALYFESSPSSWIGQGQTVDLSGPPGTMGYYRYYQQGAYTNSIHFSLGGWNLALVGDNYTAPQVGFYDDATRWPFMDNGAGLALTGHGRGNNTLSGLFEVFEAVYATDGTLISFAADFTQYDEQNTSRWNIGSVRYNSSVPIPVPEPASLSILMLTVGAALARKR